MLFRPRSAPHNFPVYFLKLMDVIYHLSGKREADGEDNITTNEHVTKTEQDSRGQSIYMAVFELCCIARFGTCV